MSFLAGLLKGCGLIKSKYSKEEFTISFGWETSQFNPEPV